MILQRTLFFIKDKHTRPLLFTLEVSGKGALKGGQCESDEGVLFLAICEMFCKHRGLHTVRGEHSTS